MQFRLNGRRTKFDDLDLISRRRVSERIPQPKYE